MTVAKTPDELKSIMMELVKAIEEAEIPADLRVAAFEKGFEALVGPTGGSGTPAAKTPPERGDDRAKLSDAAGGPTLDAIAAKLSLDPDLIREVFDVDGESLGVILAASKFAVKKAVATQEIALLVAAGRQAGGWDEWTNTGRIRDVARDYGRFDQANFSSTIKRMGSVFSFRGKGREVEVRVTRPGFEEAANLIRALAEA